MLFANYSLITNERLLVKVSFFFNEAARIKDAGEIFNRYALQCSDTKKWLDRILFRTHGHCSLRFYFEV